MGYSTLKAALDAVVKTNGRQEITGSNLNGVMTTLLQGVDVLDRANPADTSGMNKVVLKKNKTFAEQVTGANTIYEIRDNFTLSANFSMPENCALYFNGGKISGNYRITGNNTTICGKLDSIFDGITLLGNFTNTSCNVCWWGCTPFDENNQVDNSETLDKIFAGSIREILVDRKYGISFPVKLPDYSLVKGSRGTALRNYGFVANDDFSSKVIDVRGQSYTAEGMLYYYSDMNPRLDNISIDARWFSPFCLEHITGYAAPTIRQCTLYNASVAGIVQYACEKPIWSDLSAKFCHCGIFVSDHKINKNDVLDLTGATMGRDNMVTLSGCAAIGCNYGIIINSGSNTILENCETAYNSLWGLVTNGRIAVNNFYSEGDFLANFYYVGGIKKTNPLGDGYVPEEITNANLDGMLVTESLFYGQDIRFRSPIFIRGGQMSVKDAFISLKPRSYVTTNVAKADFELPSVRDAAGVDSAFSIFGNAARISLRLYGNIKIYTLNTDTGDLPEHMVVVGNTTNLSPAPSVIVDAVPQFVHPIFIAKPITFSYVYNMVGERSRILNPQTFEEHGLRLPDYNSKIETARWGGFGNSSKFDFRRNRFVELYDGIPLYKRDTTISSFNVIYYAKDKLAELFGDAKEIKVRFLVKFNESATSRINLSISFMDSSYTTKKVYGYNQGGDETYEAGIYDCIYVIPLEYLMDTTWDRINTTLLVKNESSIDVLVSDLMMYPVNAPIVPPVYSCYYAPSGTTAKRPTANPGQIYFDTNLNKSIMWNGTAWVNVDGSALA